MLQTLPPPPPPPFPQGPLPPPLPPGPPPSPPTHLKPWVLCVGLNEAQGMVQGWACGRTVVGPQAVKVHTPCAGQAGWQAGCE